MAAYEDAFLAPPQAKYVPGQLVLSSSTGRLTFLKHTMTKLLCFFCFSQTKGFFSLAMENLFTWYKLSILSAFERHFFIKLSKIDKAFYNIV